MRRPSRRVAVVLLVAPLLVAVPLGLWATDPGGTGLPPRPGDACEGAVVDDSSTTPPARGTVDPATAQDAVPAVDAGQLHLAWSDEFDGGELDPARWVNRECWQGPDGFRNDSEAWLPYPPTEDNLDVAEGSVRLRARKGGAPAGSAADMTTAMLTTRASYNTFTSGVVEARLKVPAGRGLWSAFWLMGNGTGEVGWPETGEIDVFEFVNNGAGGRGTMYSSLHWGDVVGRTVTAHHVASKSAAQDWFGDDEFHTFTLHRTPQFLRFAVDGEQVLELRPGETVEGYSTPVPVGGPLFEAPMHIRLSLEVGGQWAGQGLSPAQYEPGELVVDHVRVWHDGSAPDGVSTT